MCTFWFQGTAERNFQINEVVVTFEIINASLLCIFFFFEFSFKLIPTCKIEVV